MKDTSEDDKASGPPIAQFLTYCMARVQAKLNAQTGRVLKRSAGLTLTQWRLLSLVASAGCTTAAQLPREAVMDKGLISRNLKKLVDDGLILAKPDDMDQRSHQLVVSAKGQTVLENTRPRMRERQAALRSRLEEQEVRLLLSALDKLELASKDPKLG